jgi:heme-degrading monooxygenase HmoA
MVLEIAETELKPGMAEEFERGVAASLPIFRKAPGFIDLSLQRCIENPMRYRVFLRWETIENHTEGFRKSQGFQQWRQLVGHCFAVAPKVDHSQCVLAS